MIKKSYIRDYSTLKFEITCAWFWWMRHREVMVMTVTVVVVAVMVVNVVFFAVYVRRVTVDVVSVITKMQLSDNTENREFKHTRLNLPAKPAGQLLSEQHYDVSPEH